MKVQDEIRDVQGPPPGTDRRDNLSRLTCLDPVQRVTSSEQEQVLRQVKRDD